MKQPLHIPEQDFISARYDVDHGVELRSLLLVLSTPRSGSTYLSDLLRSRLECTPHEYFQPYQYMPILADRWGASAPGGVDEQVFVEQLIRYRTSPSGTLAINLHGSHLATYERFERFFPPCERMHLVIRRNDLIRQAVSYEIAAQSGKWSSGFVSRSQPVYSYDGIAGRAARIQQLNLLMQAWLADRGLEAHLLVYEDLVADPLPYLDAIDFLGPAAATSQPTIRRQSSNTNDDWARRFASDMLDRHLRSVEPTTRLARLRARVSRR